ncbi:MAG: DeoR/GlpR transcriptional regulator [Anaerolineae bacterium]|nr:DeoR/GlpR transcriptional regulator [Anaerolineae bacterium]
MNAKERQRAILEMVADKGVVTIDEICTQFEVSDMTARRDLSYLEGNNLLKRIHGGAIKVQAHSYEPPFRIRTRENSNEKQAIAALAATLVEDGDTIALDVGTTTLKLAEHLREKKRLTILTPSLAIASLLADQVGIRLILTGGTLRMGEQAFAGDLAVEMVNRFHVDKVFTGAAGVDLESGIADFDVEQTAVKRCLIAAGNQRILVTDSSKFGRKALVKAVPLSEIDTIVTDDRLDKAYQEPLKDIGITLHLVAAATA